MTVPYDDKALLGFFDYEHLPEKLQVTSKLYQELAAALIAKLAKSPERTFAMRKLLESKDCAVRAALQGLTVPPDSELARVPRLGERIYHEETKQWFAARRLNDGDHKGMVVWQRCVSPLNDDPPANHAP